MKLCYDEGAFDAWITEQLKVGAIYGKTPLPMLQGTPGQIQAAGSSVYTIQSKFPTIHYALTDTVITLMCGRFVAADKTDHYMAVLAPTPADDMLPCRTKEELVVRALHFAGQIENDGNFVRFTTSVDSTLDVPKLLGRYVGYMDNHSKRIRYQLANAGMTTVIQDMTTDHIARVYWFKFSTQLHFPDDLLEELLSCPGAGNFNALETKISRSNMAPSP